MITRTKLSDKYGLEIGKPNLLIISILVIAVIIEIQLIYIKHSYQAPGAWKSMDGIIFIFSWFGMLTLPIADWLRNIYVLVLWILICVLFYLYKVDQDFFTAIIPFCVLIYSQICRLIFRAVMGYHPIHLLFNTTAWHRYSTINKRKSTKIDFWYSSIYSLVGIILTVIFGIMNLKK